MGFPPLKVRGGLFKVFNPWNFDYPATPVAGSIFQPLSQTHISKSEFKNGISALLDIQLTSFCVGVDSFLPELEHL